MGWSLKESKIYPEFHSYQGPASECTATFDVPLPEQLGARYFGDKLIAGFKQDLTKKGYKLLSIMVWEDKSATLHTEYKVKVYASEKSPLAWFWIVGGVLAILAIAGVTWAIVKEISNISHNVLGVAEAAPFAFSFATIGIVIAAGLGLYLVAKKKKPKAAEVTA